jgi:hypothetical protein
VVVTGVGVGVTGVGVGVTGVGVGVTGVGVGVTGVGVGVGVGVTAGSQTERQVPPIFTYVLDTERQVLPTLTDPQLLDWFSDIRRQVPPTFTYWAMAYVYLSQMSPFLPVALGGVLVETKIARSGLGAVSETTLGP